MSSGGVYPETLAGGYFITAADGCRVAVSLTNEVATTVLCCYEHLLTAHTELKHVWGRRLSAGSVLFVLNRYAILTVSLAGIAEIVYTAPFDLRSFSTCRAALRIADAGVTLVYMAYAVFAALRMYALYNMKNFIFILVLSMGILGPCGQIFLMANEEISDGAVLGLTEAKLRCRATNCIHEGRGKHGILLRGFDFDIILVALRAHAIAFEVLLLGFTWNKTLTWRSSRVSGFRPPFTNVLLRDGTLYFTVIATASSLSLGGMVTISTASIDSSRFVIGLGLLSPMVDVITSICMSRFLLALFAAAEGDRNSYYRSSRWTSIVHLAQVETLGAQLRDVLDGRFDEDVEDAHENASDSHADEIELGEVDTSA